MADNSERHPRIPSTDAAAQTAKVNKPLPPAVNISELDLTRLTAETEALAITLTQLGDGESLPDEERRRHGAAMWPAVIMAVITCRAEMDRLGIGDATRSGRGPAARLLQQAVVRLRGAVFQLAAVVQSQYVDDWVRVLPAASILAVQQAAALLRRGCPAQLDAAATGFGAAETAGAALAGKAKRKRRHRASAKKPAPLTAKQTEAMQLVAEHKGNITAAAAAAGKSRQAMKKLYDKGCKKLGKSAVEKAAKTQGLPSDHRGQIDVDDPDAARGPGTARRR